MLAKMVGKYVYCDDNTQKGEHMDIARILVRTSCTRVLNESFNVNINGVIFRIKMTEDTHGPLRINLFQKVKKFKVDSSSESESLWKHPLDDSYEEVECKPDSRASVSSDGEDDNFKDNREATAVQQAFEHGEPKGKRVSEVKVAKSLSSFDAAVKAAREEHEQGKDTCGTKNSIL